jgi:hypothetical protein
MRRRLLTVLLATLAAITMAVPLWAALTSERTLRTGDLTASTLLADRSLAPRPRVAEAATLVLTGGVLLALASAVRRAS